MYSTKADKAVTEQGQSLLFSQVVEEMGVNCIPTTHREQLWQPVLTVGVVPLVAVVAAALPVAGLFSVPVLPPLCKGRETHPHTSHGHNHTILPAQFTRTGSRTQLVIHAN